MLLPTEKGESSYTLGLSITLSSIVVLLLFYRDGRVVLSLFDNPEV